MQTGVAWDAARRFTANGDGTVTDNLTDLVWLQDSDCFGAVDWPTALSLVNALAEGECGLTDGSAAGDWRLPNLRELLSLVDYGRFDPPLSEGHPFFNVTYDGRWSSTTSNGFSDRIAWTVGFLAGFVSGGNKTDRFLYVWPVRDAETRPTPAARSTVPRSSTPAIGNPTHAPVAQTGQRDALDTGDDGDLQEGVVWETSRRFTDNGDGTVTDDLTDLVWLQDSDCFGAVDWPTALSLANALAKGECGLTDGSAAGDWRLPTMTELLSLVDHGRYSPALPAGHPFSFSVPGPISRSHWSSTTLALPTVHDYAWSVDFGPGFPTADCKTGGSHVGLVWPVRDRR